MTRLTAVLFLFLAAMFGPLCVLAQDAAIDTQAPQGPATIKGRIFDGETGESMPYTNVFVSGTNIGTMAFTDGFYIIKGLRPGTYTIKASYISYAVGSETVTVGPGEVANLDFRLEVQAIMAEPFDVTGERAMVEVDNTGSSHYISAREMEAMPLDQVVDMISQQPGVTMQDNEIHIRGGRSDDTMFVVDGMAVKDPLGGGGYGYTIDPSIINEIEILTGGFNAEHGQAASGVVNVSTKEGTDRFEGRVSFKRDYLFDTIPKNDYRGWDDLTNFTESNNIDIVKAMMSGPDPISAGLRALGLNLPGTQYLLASASMDIRDGYLPIYSRQNPVQSPIYTDKFWSPRQQSNWNGLLKWTWNFTPHHKLNINLSRNVSVNQGFSRPGELYPRAFLDNLDNYLTFTGENILTQIYYRQVLSETSWFELTAGRNWNRQHHNVNGNDNYLTYEPIYFPSDDITGQAEGSADAWHDHYTEAYTVNGSYSFMGIGNNNFKTGFELSFTEMQLIDLKGQLGEPLNHPGKLAISEDIFDANPVTGAAYFQDTLNYRGLIVNAGLRLDAWAPGKEVQNVMANPDDYLFITEGMADEFYSNTSSFAGLDWKLRVSPRLGLSFPVTPRDKFFFNYGHFNQWPRFIYVYPQLQAQTASEIQLLGNPNLDPKVTVQYETGLQHEFGGLWSMALTFFNNDIFGYAKAVEMKPVDIGHEETPDPDDTGTTTITPVRYFNGDSARSLGIELSIIKRTTRWLSGSANLELQRSTGTSSDANEGYLSAIYGDINEQYANKGGLTRGPLLWDKPWTVSVNLDFSVFERDRPVLFGWTMPPNWSFNILMRAEAGQRYTPIYYNGYRDYSYGDNLSEIGPTKGTFNIRFNKYWNVGRNQKITFYLEARNLLNHLNYRRVNPWTGDGYQLGDFNPGWQEGWMSDETDVRPSTYSEGYAKGVVNPSYIENPRLFLWGVSYSW